MVHPERQMMESFAMPANEPRDETFPSHRVFDQLDRKTAEIEVLPEERAAKLIALGSISARDNREIPRKESLCRVDRLHCDRDVVKAHLYAFGK